MVRQHRTLFPVSKRTNYIANDVVDFDFTSENNSVKAGSVYLSGSLQTRTGVTTYNETISGTYLDQNADVGLDAFAGAHSLFRRINCETSQGVIENLDNYPRLVRMINECNMYKDDLANETDKQMELRGGQDDFGKVLIKPLGQGETGSVSFAVKPLIAFNSSSADIPFRKVGMMRLSLRLASLAEALYGDDWSASGGYWIQDLQLHYEVVPDAGGDAPIVFQKHQNIPHTINSNNANVSSTMAGLSNSASASFLRASLESDSYKNNLLQTSVIPNVTRVQFGFNDNDSSRVAYPIESNEELELNYQRSLGVDGPNSLLLSHQHKSQDKSEGFGIGIPFGALRNLTTSKFDFTVQTSGSSPSNADRYRCFLYFKSLVRV